MKTETIVFRNGSSSLITREMLESISVEVSEFLYKASADEDQEEGVIKYCPKLSLFRYNFSMPEINVSIDKQPFETTLKIRSAFVKSARVLLPLMYVIFAIVQANILSVFFKADLENVFIALCFAPTFMAVILFAVSNGLKSIYTKSFIREYRHEIEKRLLDKEKDRLRLEET